MYGNNKYPVYCYFELPCSLQHLEMSNIDKTYSRVLNRKTTYYVV